MLQHNLSHPHPVKLPDESFEVARVVPGWKGLLRAVDTKKLAQGLPPVLDMILQQAVLRN